MLLWCYRTFVGRFALHDLRQCLVVVLINNGVVATLGIDFHEAFELNDLTGRAQADLFVSRQDFDGGAFKTGCGHLAGNRAFPDQIVKLALIGFEFHQLGRVLRHIRRADTFVGFLCILGLVLIHARRFRHISVAVACLDNFAGLHYGLGGHVDAVGTHICNVAGLVEALGSAHGLAGAKAELPAGFLLQRRGHERSGRVAVGGFGLDRRDGQVARFDSGNRQFCGYGGFNVEFFQLLATKDCQARVEFFATRRRDPCGNGPVFAVLERLDLHFALDDQAQDDGLDAARRLRTRELAPEHRRQVEPYQIIQRTAGEVGIHKRLVNLARMLHGLKNGSFGDGVKHDPFDFGGLLDGFAFAQNFFEMPADRLPFAVGIGCEDQFVVGVGFHRIDNRANMLLRLGGDVPFHFEIIVGIHRTVLWRQVAHMAVGGQNSELIAEILVDRFRLGGGFYNYNGH